LSTPAASETSLQPTAASRERRIEGKKRRAGIKRLRRAKSAFD
jgi:hypothetical protein